MWYIDMMKTLDTFIIIVLRLINWAFFLQNVHYDHATNVEFSEQFKATSSGIVNLVRVFPQFTSGRVGNIVMTLLLYHPKDATMLAAPAPSYNILLDRWLKNLR